MMNYNTGNIVNLLLKNYHVKISDHIEKLSKVLIFAASDNSSSIPKPLKKGFENVEILLDGEVFYPTGDGMKRFGRGTIFWHHSGELDIWKSASTGHGYRCVCFTFQTKENVVSVANGILTIGAWQDIQTLDSFVMEVRELFYTPGIDIDMLTAWVYGTLLRQFIQNSQQNQQFPRTLYLALLHINVNLPKSIALVELASIVKCSVMHLNRLFKQHLKCTPAEYIMRRRMIHAANLLNSSLPIKRISEECDFYSLAGFYSAFRKHFHTSPNEYRKKCACSQKQKLEK